MSAVILSTALLLAGCAAQRPALSESDYLKLARTNVSEVQGWSDARLDNVAKATCGSVKDGGQAGKAGWVQSVKVLTSSGFTGRDAGQFIAYAVGRYCPDLTDYLPAK